jgi:hypothetical protein
LRADAARPRAAARVSHLCSATVSRLALTTEAPLRKWPSNPPLRHRGTTDHRSVEKTAFRRGHGDAPTHKSGPLCGPGRWHGLKQSIVVTGGASYAPFGNQHSEELNACVENSRNCGAAANVYLPAQRVNRASWSSYVGGTARSANHGTIRSYTRERAGYDLAEQA